MSPGVAARLGPGLAAFALGVAQAHAVPDTPAAERLLLELTSDSVCFIHESGQFRVPYKVRPRDTLASISEHAYGVSRFGDDIARFNDLTPGATPSPDSTIDVPSREFCMRFNPAYLDVQYEAVRQFIAAGRSGARFKESWAGQLDMWSGTVSVFDLWSKVFVPRTFTAIDVPDETRRITFSFVAGSWLQAFGGDMPIEQIVTERPDAGAPDRISRTRSNAVRRHRTEFLTEFERLEKAGDEAGAARLVEEEAAVVFEALVPMLDNIASRRQEQPGSDSLVTEWLATVRAVVRNLPRGQGRDGLMSLVDRYGSWNEAELRERGKALEQLKAAEAAGTGARYAESLADLERIQASVRALGDRIIEYNIVLAKAQLAVQARDYRSAQVHLRAALEIARSHGDISNEARIAGHLGYTYVLLDDYAAAAAALQDAYAMYVRTGLASREPDIHRYLSMVYEQSGDVERALFHNQNAFRLSRQRLQDAEEGERSPLILDKARLLRAMGQYGRAQALLETTRVAARQAADTAQEMDALYESGLTYQASGEHARAIGAFEEMLALGERISQPDAKSLLRFLAIRHKWIDEGRVRAQMGRSYLKLGESNKAFREFNEGYSFYVERKDQAGQAEMHCMLGMAYLAVGFNKDAIRRFGDAQRVADRIGLGRLRAEILGGLAAAFRANGDLQQALAHYEAADELAARGGTPGEEPDRAVDARRTFLLDYADLLMDLHRAQPGAGYDRRLFEVSERAKSTRFQATIAKATAHHVLGESPEFRRVADRERELASSVGSLRKQAEAAAGRPQAVATMSFAGQLEEQLIAAEASLKAQQSQLESRFPRYADLIRPQALSVTELQSVLRPDETAVSYLVGEKRSVAFVISRDAFRTVELAIGRADVARLVRDFRVGLDRLVIAGVEEEMVGLDDLAAFRPEVARELYLRIFAPLEPVLDADVGRVIVAADDVLFTVPFEALVDRDVDAAAFAATRQASRSGEQPFLAEYGVPHYLLRRFAFSYLPSLSVLRSLRRYPKPRSGDPEFRLVAFADPVFAEEEAPGAARDADRGPAAPDMQISQRDPAAESPGPALVLPRLAATRDEAEAIAALLGRERSRLFLRQDATEENVHRFPLQRAGFVLFATHGLLGGAASGLSESALVLSLAGNPPGRDGLLTASEVLGLDLNADAVILSACSTYGRGEAAAHGEGFAGFARSFMYAGARSLLVTHWSVDSRATRDLVVGTFSDKGAPMPIALAKAKRALQDSSRDLGTGLRGKLALSHPFFWAALVHVGD